MTIKIKSTLPLISHTTPEQIIPQRLQKTPKLNLIVLPIPSNAVKKSLKQNNIEITSENSSLLQIFSKTIGNPFAIPTQKIIEISSSIWSALAQMGSKLIPDTFFSDEWPSFSDFLISNISKCFKRRHAIPVRIEVSDDDSLPRPRLTRERLSYHQMDQMEEFPKSNPFYKKPLKSRGNFSEQEIPEEDTTSSEGSAPFKEGSTGNSTYKSRREYTYTFVSTFSTPQRESFYRSMDAILVGLNAEEENKLVKDLQLYFEKKSPDLMLEVLKGVALVQPAQKCISLAVFLNLFQKLAFEQCQIYLDILSIGVPEDRYEVLVHVENLIKGGIDKNLRLELLKIFLFIPANLRNPMGSFVSSMPKMYQTTHLTQLEELVCANGNVKKQKDDSFHTLKALLSLHQMAPNNFALHLEILLNIPKKSHKDLVDILLEIAKIPKSPRLDVGHLIVRLISIRSKKFKLNEIKSIIKLVTLIIAAPKKAQDNEIKLELEPILNFLGLVLDKLTKPEQKSAFFRDFEALAALRMDIVVLAGQLAAVQIDYHAVLTKLLSINALEQCQSLVKCVFPFISKPKIVDSDEEMDENKNNKSTANPMQVLKVFSELPLDYKKTVLDALSLISKEQISEFVHLLSLMIPNLSPADFADLMANFGKVQNIQDMPKGDLLFYFVKILSRFPPEVLKKHLKSALQTFIDLIKAPAAEEQTPASMFKIVNGFELDLFLGVFISFSSNKSGINMSGDRLYQDDCAREERGHKRLEGCSSPEFDRRSPSPLDSPPVLYLR